MPTGWGAHHGAWRGETSGADLTALFAATASLSKLQQALEDRRLDLQIAQAGQAGQTGQAWRTVLALGRVAAPLWLADALVALAGAFYDAEAQPHADRPASVPAYIHDLVAALLMPVEDIVADVTAALADPGHRTALVAPLLVGPGGEIAGDEPPEPPSTSYTKELATGARRVHTSAAAALASLRAAIDKPPAPAWLEAGLRRLDGELQAAGARLDMAEVRLASLGAAPAGTRAGDPAALDALCRDLWRIAGVAIAAGQALADPHLLPEAAAAGQSGTFTAPPSEPGHAPSTPAVVHAQPFKPVEALPLPFVDAGAAPLQRPATASPSAAPASKAPDAVPLPHIEEGAPPQNEPAPALPQAASLASPPPSAASLPTIGEPPPTQPEPPHPKKPAEPTPRPPTPSGDAEDNQGPTITFPKIG